MSKLQKLQCDSCGGHIDGTTLKCQMCGMQYRLDDDFTLGRVEVYHGKFVELRGRVGIPAYSLYEFGEDGPALAAKMTIDELRKKLADKILPFMEFQQMFDPHQMSMETYASIRVAEPRYGSTLDPVRNLDWIESEFRRYGV